MKSNFIFKPFQEKKILILLLAFLTFSFGAMGQLVFGTSGISAEINTSSGRLISVTNRLTQSKYVINSDKLLITIDNSEVNFAQIPTKCIEVTRTTSTFKSRFSGLEVTWVYIFPENRGYFDRHLSVKNITGHSILLKSVRDAELDLNNAFQSVFLHNDNMAAMDSGSEKYTETATPNIYQTAINVFMSNEKGGLCMGLKYPYFKAKYTRKSIAFFYETNYRLKPGETLDLPTMFCGAFQKTGYVIKKQLDWKPRILSTKQEQMDLGQVRAMQQVMRDYLPQEPLAPSGYFILFNSWWANESLQVKLGTTQAEAYCKLADKVKQSKCIDMMLLAPVWVGWADFIHPGPEIDSIGEKALFPMNAAIAKVAFYAHSISLPISSFCEPNSLERHYRKDRPDWKVQPEENSTKVLIQNCHANNAYERWFYRLICNAVDTCKLSGWAWDHSWLRRPALCYSKTHGHEPGNVEFQQYYNVTGLIQKLRDRYPHYLFDIYWGLKEAGPWSLRGLNTQENIYENNSPAPPHMSAADDLRFQHWYNHNYRFIPTYMDMAFINFKKEKNGHLYSLLSCMSASTHGSLSDWVPFKKDSEADTVFALMRYWKEWASKNLDYLKDRVDLFGQPCRKDGIDGTAHIKGDKGFIFIFNPTSDTHQGSIPLTKLIGLTSGSRFELSEISSGKSVPMGIYKKGDNFVFPIVAKSAIVIEVKPSKKHIDRPATAVGTKVQQAFIKGYR